MLTSQELATLSDDITELYLKLEFEIKKDMLRRINRLQKITDSTLWQAEILKETGALKNNVDKIISKYNKKTQKELKALFYAAMEQSKNNDIKYYTFARRSLSDSQKQKLNTSINRIYNADVINKTYANLKNQFNKLYGDIVRMTLTVADESERVFLRECNNAYMKVSSGAFSWDNAYKSAINEQARAAYADAAINISRDGVKTILYNYSGTTRRYTIEAATRMNVITGINQTASQQTLENADEMSADLVEVSAHIDARNRDVDGRPWANHAEIQGKIYCINGERDYIDANGETQHAPNFADACGLGEPDGICGINCRHSFYPYLEGTPSLYSDNEINEMNAQTVTLDGKTITPYEAEEELRLCERNIRQYKSDAMSLELTHNTEDPRYNKAREKIYTWQEKARHITDETGIERKYINEYIGTPDGKQPRGLKPHTSE